MKNLQFDRCTVNNCGILTSEIENVTVDGLDISGGGRINHFRIEGCVFNRVKLKGAIKGTLQLNPGPDYSMNLRAKNDPNYEESWREFYKSYYDHVEWALDLSEVEFESCPWLDSVPGRLIRKDPTTQVLVRREKLDGVDLKAIMWKGATGGTLPVFLQRGLFDDIVVMAAKRNRGMRKELEDIRILRDLGLAEPD